MTKLPPITEDEFTSQVIQYAMLHGWRVAHFRPARTARGWRTAVQGDGAGFPDLVLARHGLVLFAELKAEKGKLSPEQEQWQRTVNGMVWRPSQWPEIERMLQ